ncbi:hypothetical protein L3Y34_000418 [Caenorhabditis briggsae]|uniref:Uncharacterized protein n=1 Tax=Caenorhabditis briggsae TaxID=6238 RepID=A0AAE9D9H6_CAEBR|nr:hypothetical protein L3Y34_000418 [Caenorhabditis briggsae]
MSDDETMSSELPDPPPFKQIDQWLSTIRVHECTKAFALLEAYYTKGNCSAEILWRLAKYFLTIANFPPTKEEHLKEVQKGIGYAREAFEVEITFSTAKWAAISSYKLIKLVGFKEKMEELNQCKDDDDGELGRCDAESGKMDERASRIRGKSRSNKQRKGGVGREA